MGCVAGAMQGIQCHTHPLLPNIMLVWSIKGPLPCFMKDFYPGVLRQSTLKQAMQDRRPCALPKPCGECYKERSSGQKRHAQDLTFVDVLGFLPKLLPQSQGGESRRVKSVACREMAGQWDGGVCQGSTQPLRSTQCFCVVRSLRTGGCGCFQTCSRIAWSLGDHARHP